MGLVLEGKGNVSGLSGEKEKEEGGLLGCWSEEKLREFTEEKERRRRKNMSEGER